MGWQATGFIFSEYLKELVIDFRDNGGYWKVGTLHGGGCDEKVVDVMKRWGRCKRC